MKSDVCKRFKELRTYFGESQSGFAEKLGIKQGHVSAIEIAHNNVSIYIMEKLVEVYNVNLNWLVSGNGSMFYSKGDQIGLDDIILRLEEYKNEIGGEK
ncbi:MAG: helix-turn-helix transcriptional regulator [Salinivirgaceae bacterium]|nr:helix-turn-helix transcriptional regulator [Salinivirgaceae bacterium]